MTGSALDYQWWYDARTGGYYITDINPADGDTGTDLLIGVEQLVFSDYTAELTTSTHEAGLTERLNVIDTQSASVDQGELIAIEFTSYVFHDHNWGSGYELIDWNIVAPAGYSASGLVSTVVGEFSMGRTETRQVNFAADYQGEFEEELYVSHDERLKRYTDDDLALGEQRVHTFTVTVGDVTEQVDVTVTGVNDNPYIDRFEAVSLDVASGQSVIDLSAFGIDIDSDDDGSTLTYSIVSVEGGHEFIIDGSNLVHVDTGLLDSVSTTEHVDFAVTLIATDRHGATSRETDLIVSLYGTQQAVTNVLNSSGNIDYSALGIVPDEPVNYGKIRRQAEIDFWEGTWPESLGSYADTAFEDIAPLIEAGGDFAFNANGIWGADGLDAISLSRSEQSDQLVIRMHQEWGVFESISLETSGGQDTFILDVASERVAMVEDFHLDTGGGDDQVILHLSSDQGARVGPDPSDDWGYDPVSITTGTGNDLIDIVLEDTGQHVTYDYFGNPTYHDGVASIEELSIHMGAGHDELRIVLTSTDEPTYGGIDFGSNRVYLMSGDDHVSIDNSGVTNLIDGGLNGTIVLGFGDDVFDFNVYSAEGEENVVHINADNPGDLLDPEYYLPQPGYQPPDVDNYDVLNLLTGGHDDFEIIETGEINLDFTWQTQSMQTYHVIQTDGQLIYAYGFEEINTLDGDLLLL